MTIDSVTGAGGCMQPSVLQSVVGWADVCNIQYTFILNQSIPNCRERVGQMSERAVVLCLDVGGTVLKGAVCARGGAELFRVDRPTNAHFGPDAVLAEIESTIAELAGAVRPGHKPVAVGLIVPGLVDPHRGTALYSVNIGWRDVAIAERIRHKFGMPVGLDHDVRAAGLAEATLGRARGIGNALYLSVGTGVAAALIVDGRLTSGHLGMNGEIGHVPVFQDGELCACGQHGCLEAHASAAAIARRYTRRAGLAGASAAVSAEEVLARAGAGEHAAQEVWADALTGLSRAVLSCVLLLDPELVVLGGGLAQAGDALFQPLRRQVQDALAWRTAPAIEPAHFGSDAGRVGAALVGWNAAESIR